MRKKQWTVFIATPYMDGGDSGASLTAVHVRAHTPREAIDSAYLTNVTGSAEPGSYEDYLVLPGKHHAVLTKDEVDNPPLRVR